MAPGLLPGAALAVALTLTACSGTPDAPVPGSSSAGPLVHVTLANQTGSAADVEAQLCAAGLVPRVVDAPPITGAGRFITGYAVWRVSPPAGSLVAVGSVVDLRLSIRADAVAGSRSAPARQVVPDVTGREVDAALRALTDAGFLVDVTTITPTGALLVTTQRPAGGTTASGGSTVRISVGAAGSDACAPHG